MKFNQTLMSCVQKDLEQNLIPMLLGEPGIGKSSWVEALAARNATKCFTLACNQLADKADLTGARLVPVTDENGATVSYKQVFYPHAVIHDAIAYANENPREEPILFMDEMNRTTPDVTSECLSIPTLRSIGSTKLPVNLKIILAGNDKGNVTSLDEASISRFVLYHVEPDVQTFLHLDDNLNIYVREVLNENPNLIFCKKSVNFQNNSDDDDSNVNIDDILGEDDDMSQITTPRTISGVSRWLNNHSIHELTELLKDATIINGQTVSVLEEVLIGHVGETNFCKILLDKISQSILNNTNVEEEFKNKIPKPKCYDKLKEFTTIDELDNYIQDLSKNELSTALVYAIYEKQDNTIIVGRLMSAIDKLDPSSVQNLITAYNNGLLDEQNLQTALLSKSKYATTLQNIIQI